MAHKWSRLICASFLGILPIPLSGPAAEAAVRYKVLHSFRGHPDGGGPLAGLAIDAKSNLYGGTTGGGAHGEGTVFELTLGQSGKWTETILHSFCSQPGCHDGYGSTSTPAVGPAGDVYGTSSTTIFQLTPGSNGWSFTVVYDYLMVENGVLLDASGNLYGYFSHGQYNRGAVAELSPGSSGWTEQDLFSFDGSDGGAPRYAPTWDASGNLYGVDEGTGRFYGGEVFKLQHTSNGWQESVLHGFPAFNGDGHGIQGGLTYNPANGKLYGTTEQGGKANFGIVFELSPQKNGRWKESIIYQFTVDYDGAGPGGTLAIAKDGSIYGTAGGGTGPCGGGGCGLVYKLTPHKNGKWSYKVLHRFLGPDGALPIAGPTLDSKGNLYGTTEVGGKYTYGVVYEIMP